VDRPEPRSAVAAGIEWASRITTVGLEFALPPLLGWALDRWWGIMPVATVVGAILGFAAGMMHLLRIARDASAGGAGRTKGTGQGA
jgi:ATP synthase protein I